MTRRKQINDWTAVPTADNAGVSISPQFQDDHEIAVSIRNGRIEVHIHKSGQDAPLASMTYTITKEAQE